MVYPGNMRRRFLLQAEARRAADVQAESSDTAGSKAVASKTELSDPSMAEFPVVKDIMIRANEVERNWALLIAKFLIFAGLMMLSWARAIPQNRYLFAAIKTAAVIGFFLLYPFYAAGSFFILAVVYLFSGPQRT